MGKRGGGEPENLYLCAVTYLGRWVYIIEGCFSTLVAVIVFFGLPNDPTNAWFLNAEERDMMRCRNGQRQKYLGKALSSRFGNCTKKSF
jgi:hypothetical protein